MLHHVIYITFLSEPPVKNLMAHSDAKGINAQKFIRAFVECHCNTFCIVFMFPMEMGFVIGLSFFSINPTISLIFNIKKLCRVKPMPRVVSYSIPADGLGSRFAHHTARVPNGFNSTSLTNRLMLLGTITNGVNIFNVCF